MDASELAENFEVLDDWGDRYRYIIELGKELPAMADELKTDGSKVRGCMSQVWLVGRAEGDRLHFLADSDAHIVRGLIAILLALFSGKTREEIDHTDPEELFQRLGLDKHLSPGRNNGLHAMVQRIKEIAAL